MNKPSKISDKDKKLFRDTIGDIEKIKDSNIIIDKPKPSSHPKRNKENELDFSHTINESGLNEDLVDDNKDVVKDDKGSLYFETYMKGDSELSKRYQAYSDEVAKESDEIIKEISLEYGGKFLFFLIINSWFRNFSGLFSNTSFKVSFNGVAV